jgi:hypothetical protein
MSLLMLIQEACASSDGTKEPESHPPTKETKEDERSPGPPRPPELARWPIERREQWGRLANDLQDQGVPWPEHERQAFDLVKAEMEAATP